MRHRTHLTTLSLVLAIATASGCLSSETQVKPLTTQRQTVTGMGGTKLSSAVVGGVVELPSGEMSTDGTKLAYRLASISKNTPCVGAGVTVRDAAMAIAPNSDTAEKTNASGKFLLKAVPPDIVLYVTAQFDGLTLATIATATTKHEVDVTIDLASTLAAAGLLPLFTAKDANHPAEFSLATLSVPLYNDLVAAVEQALDDSTTIKPTAQLKDLAAAFTTLKSSDSAVQKAYDAIVGNLGASVSTGGNGGSGGSPSPGASGSPGTGASGTPTPGASGTTTPSATPTTRTFPPIIGAIAPVAGATSTANADLKQMAVIPPVNPLPGVVLVPAGDHVVTIDSTGKVTSYDASKIHVTFSGARAIAVNGTTAYMIATVNSALSLITLDVTKLETGSTTPATVQALVGLPANSQLDGMAFDPASGKIFVADNLNQTVDTLVPSSGQLATYMGTAAAAGASTSGPVASFQLRNPAGLAIDGSTLYVADSRNFRIVKVDLTAGTASVLTGDVNHPELHDGSLSDAHYASPLDLFVTPDHKLLVADRDNGALREVDPAGDAVISYEQKGDTPGNLLTLPVSVALLGTDTFAIDDKGLVQKFTAN